MTKTVIDAKTASDLLHRAVAEKGYEYQDPNSPAAGGTGCEYADDKGNPLCIVGHVLHYAGVNLSDADFTGSVDSIIDLPMVPDYDQDKMIPTGANGSLWRNRDVEFTVDAFRLLEKAQLEQDSGTFWGPAVEIAEKEVGV
jgi:hypothetical protein